MAEETFTRVKHPELMADLYRARRFMDGRKKTEVAD